MDLRMIVADYHLHTPLLGEALAGVGATTVAVDRLYTAEDVSVRCQFRVQGEGLSEFAETLESDPTVADATELAEYGDRRQYRVSLTSEGRRAATFADWVAVDGVLLSGTGTAEGWEMRMRFPDREALGGYRRGVDDRGLEMTLHGLHSRHRTEEDDRYGLTGPQQDILITAIEMGYFDIPRSASLAEVGSELGVTGQAASERLRRALKTYLTNTLYAERTRDVEAESDLVTAGL
jgi:hypothetical protein